MPEDPFSDDYSFDRALGPNEEGNRAYFGKNVLQGLIDRIDDFVRQRQPRWERRTHRVGAPILLGCYPNSRRVSRLRARRPLARVEAPARVYSQAFCDAGGGTRTPDTRIMIPLL
jgi:hypothetical protein